MPKQTIVFDVNDRHARAGFNRLQREVSELDREFSATRSAAQAAGTAIAALGDRSRATAKDVDRLGTEAQQSATHIDRLGIAAKQQNTLWRDINGNLRDAHGRYANAAHGADRFTNAVDGAHRILTAENQRLLQQLARDRIDAATAASAAEVEGFTAAAQAGKAYADQRRRQIDAMPHISSPDAQSGNFASQLRKDFEATARQGRTLLDVMRQIANYAFQTDVDTRIPDPIVRGAALDERIAAEAQGQQTIETLRQAAAEQGRQFLNSVLRREEGDIQKSIQTRARSYRQFANLVSNTFLNAATGRQQSFEQVATQFIRHSLRIVARAGIEHQIRLRLDDTLTAHKIANIHKVSVVQQAAFAGIGGPGVGHLPGLANIGSLLGGGGLALGAASLLFPTELKNLTGGIKDTIGGLLSNIASIPDKAFGAQQVFLKIGDNEIKDISDIQTDLRNENRL